MAKSFRITTSRKSSVSTTSNRNRATHTAQAATPPSRPRPSSDRRRGASSCGCESIGTAEKRHTLRNRNTAPAYEACVRCPDAPRRSHVSPEAARSHVKGRRACFGARLNQSRNKEPGDVDIQTERWNGAVLQGLGHRCAGGVFAWLAA